MAARPRSARSSNEGSAGLVISAGSGPGEPVDIQVSPEGSRLEVENRLVTIPEAGNGVLTLQRLPGSSHVVVEGQIPARAPPFTRTASVDNPTGFFVEAFRAALLAEGIQVSGKAVDIDDVSPKPDLAGAKTLTVRRSPPLTELATSMMKVSQNQYAEMLLMKVGKDAARARLRDLGVADGTYILADGSGLSRYNYVTADTIVHLQQLHERRHTHVGFSAYAPDRRTTAPRPPPGRAPARGKVRPRAGPSTTRAPSPAMSKRRTARRSCSR